MQTIRMRPAVTTTSAPHSRRLAVVVRAEGKINTKGIRATEEKVADFVKASELPKPKAVYCRCWKSDKFPMCDGKHVAHNKATGDNIGPLVIDSTPAS